MKSGKIHENEPWGPKYRWEHTLRVAYWAWILAKEEQVDIEKNVTAGLFHDVSHFVSKDYRKHGEKAAEIASEFMLKVGYAKDFVEDVSYTVKSHVGEHNPKTIYAKILQDADTLDRFGFYRMLLFGKRVDLSNLEKTKVEIQSLIEYFEKAERGEFGPMWTKTGKVKVDEFIKVYKVVYKGIISEIENTRTPETFI
jgi:putative nucleotidyltransferase with HDIG domain